MNIPPRSISFSKPFAASLCLLFGSSLLISCQVNQLAGKSLNSLKSVAGNLMPSRVPIADVRNKDLQKMASGADLALAWDRKLNRWVYTAVDYKPATLPDTQSQPVDTGLLPPLRQGENTTLEGQGQSSAW